MDEIRPTNVTQVVLVFEPANSADYGRDIWHVLNEVERVYSELEPRMRFQRFFISSRMPETRPHGLIETMGSLLFGVEGSDTPRGTERVITEIPEGSVKSKNRRTLDQEKIGKVVREILGFDASEKLVIYTDKSITPPPEWRYMIWESFPDEESTTAVISLAPCDPRYWRDSDPEWIVALTKRARAAGIGAVGDLVGLQPCDNPKCYMFGDVDSVTVLDDMLGLFGPEHGLKRVGRGVVRSSGSDAAGRLESPDAA